jgi:hypothetical protein
MQKKYIVRLTDEERDELQLVVKKLKGSSQKVVSAHHDHRGGFRAGYFPGVELQRDRDWRLRSHSLGRTVTWHGY